MVTTSARSRSQDLCAHRRRRIERDPDCGDALGLGVPDIRSRVRLRNAQRPARRRRAEHDPLRAVVEWPVEVVHRVASRQGSTTGVPRQRDTAECLARATFSPCALDRRRAVHRSHTPSTRLGTSTTASATSTLSTYPSSDRASPTPRHPGSTRERCPKSAVRLPHGLEVGPSGVGAGVTRLGPFRRRRECRQSGVHEHAPAGATDLEVGDAVVDEGSQLGQDRAAHRRSDVERHLHGAESLRRGVQNPPAGPVGHRRGRRAALPACGPPSVRAARRRTASPPRRHEPRARTANYVDDHGLGLLTVSALDRPTS